MNIDQALISLCRKHDLTALSVGVTTPSDDRAPWFTTYAHYTLNGERGCASGSEPTAAEAIAHAIQQVNEARACAVDVPAMELDVAA